VGAGGVCGEQLVEAARGCVEVAVVKVLEDLAQPLGQCDEAWDVSLA
jgi:hypothetical protein